MKQTKRATLLYFLALAGVVLGVWLSKYENPMGIGEDLATFTHPLEGEANRESLCNQYIDRRLISILESSPACESESDCIVICYPKQNRGYYAINRNTKGSVDSELAKHAKHCRPEKTFRDCEKAVPASICSNGRCQIFPMAAKQVTKPDTRAAKQALGDL